MRATLHDRPIDAAALLAEVNAPENGAAILFVGTVREQNDGRAVIGIDYSAYAAMAQRELDGIAGEAVARFGTRHVVVEHRVGTLNVGETSVAIAVAHARRAAAFDAARFVIEEIKRRVPIWKREHYTDGTREWVDPTRAGSASPEQVPQDSAAGRPPADVGR
jgi:molybdopterin synthase catalytic subunit